MKGYAMNVMPCASQETFGQYPYFKEQRDIKECGIFSKGTKI